MSFIKSKDGTSIFYDDLGAGRPVILIHGWGFNSDSWEYVTSQLLQHGLRCIVYDQRGSGRSGKPWENYDYSSFAGDLAALIEALDLHHVTLVGHAMGCGVITRYLHEYGQQRAERAIFLATTTPYLLKAEDNPGGVDRAQFDGMIEAMGKDRPAFVSSLSQGFFAGSKEEIPVSTPLLTWAFSLVMQTAPHAGPAVIRTTTETDQRDELKKISLPVLLIHGGAATGAPISQTAEKTLSYLPNAQLIVYEESAAGFYITEGGRVARDILTFIGA
jgi:non-heme chloroperoxidase